MSLPVLYDTYDASIGDASDRTAFPDYWNNEIVPAIESGMVKAYPSYAQLVSNEFPSSSDACMAVTQAERTVWAWFGSSWVSVWSPAQPWQTFPLNWWNDNNGNVGLSIGNGNYQHRYTVVGKTCRGMVWQQWGTSTNRGTGNYYWKLPLVPKTFQSTFGTAFVICNSVAMDGVLTSPGSGQFIECWVNDHVSNPNGMSLLGAYTGTTSTTQAVWGQNDRIQFCYEYEVA